MYLRGPNEVDGCVWTNGIRDIVGTVSERGGRSSHDLKEGVGVLSTVVVVLASSVNLLNVSGEEILMLLLVNNILLDTTKSEVLDPEPCDRRSVPCARWNTLLGFGQLTKGTLVDDSSGRLRDGSDVRVTSAHLGLRYVSTALLKILNVVLSGDALVGALDLELLSGQVAFVKVRNVTSSDTLRALARLRTLEEKRSFDDLPAFELPIILDDLAV